MRDNSRQVLLKLKDGSVPIVHDPTPSPEEGSLTTFTYLADAFIQSNLQCFQAIHFFFISMCVPWELNPQSFALLTQCSTTEPQELFIFVIIICKSPLLFHRKEGRGEQSSLACKEKCTEMSHCEQRCF